MTRRRAARKWQGEDEQIAYFVDTTAWGGYDSDAIVTLIDANGGDISDTHLEGSPSVVGNVITTPLVKNLSAGVKYTLRVQWKHNGNVLEVYCHIIGEK